MRRECSRDGRGHHPGSGSSTFVTASRGAGPEYSTREEGGKHTARCSFCSDALYDGVRYGSKYNPPSWSFQIQPTQLVRTRHGTQLDAR
jgi:hypothetical protein